MFYVKIFMREVIILTVFIIALFSSYSVSFIRMRWIIMLTAELEEKLNNTGIFDEEMIENNAPPELAEVLSKFIDERRTNKAEIIRILNVDRNYGYQILNGTRAPTRNCLIRIALILKLGTDSINYLLKLAEKPPLYVRNTVDAKVFYAVQHNMEYFEAVDFIWGKTSAINVPSK